MSTIETKVMGAVAVIRVARIALSATALKIYVLVLALWGIGRLVWVSKVFENFLLAQKGGAAAAGDFILAAVSHAHLGVQLMLLVVVLAAVSLLADVLRIAPAAAGRGLAA